MALEELRRNTSAAQSIELLKSASAADANALFRMALHYELGRGVPRDVSMALKLFHEA